MNQVQKMGLALLALLPFAIPAHAQNSQVRSQANLADTKGNANLGCTNADDLLDQAGEVISRLQKITPADWSSNPNDFVDTLRDLKGRAELLNYKLADCFNNEAIGGAWHIGDGPMPLKMRAIATEIDYLNFVSETRFTGGDKSYFADSMLPDMEQKIPECKGIPEFMRKVDDLISQTTDEAMHRIMPRDMMPFYEHGKQLLDCGLALVKGGNSAAARSVYGDVAAIDNLMVMADANVEAKLNRALAIPMVQAQPIIIRYGPKSCTGHVWGDENYRTIDWDCN